MYFFQQAGNTIFNRAMLFNIGFKEALKFDQYECFIFHDVDLIPEDDRNEYSCPASPRHLSVAVDKFNYRQVLDQMISFLNKKIYPVEHTKFAHFELLILTSVYVQLL